MTQESLILEAIKAAPHDTAARLVNADWLEERSDPRAELIRIEEEMRTLPVFSDRFWQLKPRRYELMRKSPWRWLEALRYRSDCRPTFADVPNGWKEWWRLIRVFTERWLFKGRDRLGRSRPPGFLPDVGGRTVEIADTEKRCGRSLPPSLREWLAFRLETWPACRASHEIDVFKGGAAVSLSSEFFGDAQVAIRHADLNIDDPPVVEYEKDGCYVVDQKLTSFELSFVLTCVEGNGGGFAVVPRAPDDLVVELRQDFPIYFHYGNPRESDCFNGDTEIFEKDNMLVILQHRPAQQGCYLRMEVFKPLLRTAIPEYLWDQARHADAFHGMFSPESMHRRRRRR